VSVDAQSAESGEQATGSADETMAIAADLARRLRPGDVVLLRGELGSGKTTFVRGAAAELGHVGRVTSPTFAIGNIYRGESAEIAHLDLFRLDDIAVGDEAVLGDYLTPERIAFVEWPHAELAEDLRLRAVVELAHAGEDRRTITVKWVDHP
jgi:tRNA threonylcarbamoyladenosine biosynthesis protein TsaE